MGDANSNGSGRTSNGKIFGAVFDDNYGRELIFKHGLQLFRFRERLWDVGGSSAKY
ncbi:hypothetical protein [Nocardia abscessus]|uniref:hypothetical protein n=1 Tax=Nocardia abscessus TaxID=120957 RepID=UPI0012F7AD03|nr:hypothetical protein [Nocardia abscessus]MCC3332035.1 hypothetical protein [Nocardia abscessus]